MTNAEWIAQYADHPIMGPYLTRLDNRLNGFDPAYRIVTIEPAMGGGIRFLFESPRASVEPSTMESMALEVLIAQTAINNAVLASRYTELEGQRND